MEAEAGKVKITEYYFRMGDKVFRERRLEDGSLLDIEEVPVALVAGYSIPWSRGGSDELMARAEDLLSLKHLTPKELMEDLRHSFTEDVAAEILRRLERDWRSRGGK